MTVMRAFTKTLWQTGKLDNDTIMKTVAGRQTKDGPYKDAYFN